MFWYWRLSFSHYIKSKIVFCLIFSKYKGTGDNFHITTRENQHFKRQLICQVQMECENDPSSQHCISSQGESDCLIYPWGVDKNHIHRNVYRIWKGPFSAYLERKMSKQISAWFLEQHSGEQAAQKGEEQRPLICAQDTGQQIPFITHEPLFNCPLKLQLFLKSPQEGKTYQSNQRNS